MASDAHASAPATASRIGMVASQPCPPPSAVTTVVVRFPERSRSPQSPISESSGISGLVSVAASIHAADTPASTSVVRGSRRQTSASGTARKGSAAMRKRGPGVAPPNGCQ
ncbi:MAG TPA: hypothetical protein VH817_21960 [Thermoleophilaceae bacterium]